MGVWREALAARIYMADDLKSGVAWDELPEDVRALYLAAADLEVKEFDDGAVV